MKAPKSFKYAPDGHTTRDVKEGDEMTDQDLAQAKLMGILKEKKPFKPTHKKG